MVATDGSDSTFDLTKLPGNGTGVYGKGGNTGVYGKGSTYGVYGKGNSYGVYGNGYYGVYGSGSNYGGYFVGNVFISGYLSKAGGSFKIDHPLDPANSYLYHSFVESPDMLNIYNGLVQLDGQGQAEIEMPEWFEALNSDFRYQLTSIGQPMPNLFIADEIKNRKFKIGGGLAGQKVSWQITGIRQDACSKNLT